MAASKSAAPAHAVAGVSAPPPCRCGARANALLIYSYRRSASTNIYVHLFWCQRRGGSPAPISSWLVQLLQLSAASLRVTNEDEGTARRLEDACSPPSPEAYWAATRDACRSIAELPLHPAVVKKFLVKGGVHRFLLVGRGLQVSPALIPPSEKKRGRKKKKIV